MSRQPFTPTDDNRNTVRLMAACGITQPVMSKIVGCTEKTLRKHFSVELETGLALANTRVANVLFKKACDGNIAAAIFWMKTRGGWRERQHVTLDLESVPDDQLIDLLNGQQ